MSRIRCHEHREARAAARKTNGKTKHPAPPLHRIFTIAAGVAVAEFDLDTGRFELDTLGGDPFDEKSHLEGFAGLAEPGGATPEAKEIEGGQDPVGPQDGPAVREHPQPMVFVGSVKLDGGRVGKSAGRIADEVISHLAALPNAKVDVTMEIRVTVPDGASESVGRTVSENATVLKFKHASFEED